MRVLVVTANFGNGMKDDHQEDYTIKVNDISVRYLRYNDSNTQSRKNGLHPRLKAKIPKMMEWYFNPGYDYYIWMDSRFEKPSHESIMWLINECKDHDMVLFKHPSRSSIWAESDHVLDLLAEGNQYIKDRYEGEDIRNQVRKYLNTPGFKDDKLFACGLFIYSKNLVSDKQDNIMKEWFFHNCLYSVQDQLSLPYLLAKYPLDYKTLDINIFNIPHFKYN